MKNLTRLFVAFIIAIELISSTNITSYASNNGNVTVYVTNTGKRYHRANCSYLKSCKSLSLSDAVARGYSACSRCKPPSLGIYNDSDENPYVSSGKSNKSTTSSSTKKGSSLQNSNQIVANNTSSSNSDSSGMFLVVFGLAALGLGAKWLFSAPNQSKDSHVISANSIAPMPSKSISVSNVSTNRTNSTKKKTHSKPKKKGNCQCYSIGENGTTVIIKRVNSSVFNSVGYNVNTQTLILDFKEKGRKYFYNIPKDKWNKMIASSSLGSYYHNHIESINNSWNLQTSRISSADTVQKTNQTENISYSSNPKAHSISKHSEASLINDIRARGLAFYDKRGKGGSLWIVGGNELIDFISQLERQYSVKFYHSINGGRTTGYKESWFTKSR